MEPACVARGANGSLVQSEDEEVVVTGVPGRVVDTVGAGDAFTAGMLAAVPEGKSLADATAIANRLAARVATSAGGLRPSTGRNSEAEGSPRGGRIMTP